VYLASVGAGSGVQNSSSNFRGFRAKKIAENCQKKCVLQHFSGIQLPQHTSSITRCPGATTISCSRPENQQGQPKELRTHPMPTPCLGTLTLGVDAALLRVSSRMRRLCMGRVLGGGRVYGGDDNCQCDSNYNCQNLRTLVSAKEIKAH
jgi:hypothetical protein